MSTDPTLKKEAWLEELLRKRNYYWDNANTEEQRLAHVVLYCRKDPKKMPGCDPELFVMVFAGDFYAGPDAGMPIEDFKEAWSRMISYNAIAGDAIASIGCQEVWQIKARPGEKMPKDFSKDPRAEELLTFSADHLEFGQHAWTAKIATVDGKRKLNEWVEVKNLKGRMFDFLPKKKVTHMEQMAAIEVLRRIGK